MIAVAIPGWAIAGAAAAVPAGLMPFLQERLRMDPLSLNIGMKIILLVLTLPMVCLIGLPTDPVFYGWVAVTALLYAVNDVLYYRIVAEHGAGTVTRLLPLAVIFTFVGWFALNPALLQAYLARPWLSAAIVAVLCCAIFFASRLRRSNASWAAARALWYTLLAAVAGPIISKLALDAAPGTGPIGYIFVQAAMMLPLWLLWRRRVMRQAQAAGTERLSIPRAHLLAYVGLGLLSFLSIWLKNTAFTLADNPAYVTILQFTNSLWVLAFYRLAGRPRDADTWAGLGVVACAAALVLLKTL